MNGEILVLLQRLKLGVLRAHDAKQVRFTVEKHFQLGLEVWNDDLRNAIQIGQPIAFGVGHPVLIETLKHNSFALRVLADHKGTSSDDLGRIGIDVPDLCERPLVDVGLEDVLREDRLAHRAQERRERDRQDATHCVVVDRSHRHRRFLPFAVVVKQPERERRAVGGWNVLVVDDLVEGELNIRGGEGLTVMPDDIAAQMEGPAQSVSGDIPRFGQVRLRLAGQPGDVGQTLKQIPQYAGRTGIVGQGQVEGQRLGDGGERQRTAVLANVVLEIIGIRAELRDDVLTISGRSRGVVGAANRERRCPDRSEQQADARPSLHPKPPPFPMSYES